jgi:hypothetical protein
MDQTREAYEMAVLEKDLRDMFRDQDRFPYGSVTLIEPGLGCDSGVADVLVTVKPVMVPLELKLGDSVVSELRASQRAWVKDGHEFGRRHFGMSIAKSGKRLSLFELKVLNNVVVEDLICQMKPQQLKYSSLERLLRRRIK